MDTPIPPLPCAYGDARVPLAIWRQIAVTEDLCWLWSGKGSPTGSPIYRRKSVWRSIYDALCGGKASDLPANCRALCGNQKCVNPDHRVPPQDRIPVLSCPTCGQPTYQQHRPGLDIAPIPERPPAIHPEVVVRLEGGTKFSWNDAMAAEVEPEAPPSEVQIERHPATVDYGPSDHYRLTGRIYSEGKRNRFEIRDETERSKWVTEDQLTKPQHSDMLNRVDAHERGKDDVWIVVTREERYGR